MLAWLPAGILLSQVSEEKRAGFQFSFIPPLSTQGTQASAYSNAVSFNLLAGISREVTAFSISGLGMYVSDDLKGFHLSGLGTYSGGEGKGMMIGGLFNKTAGYKGIQFGGLSNITEAMNGFQLAGLSNWIGGDLKGFQFAGLINKAENVEGVQFAGLVNVAKNVKGLQFGALLNIAESNDYPVGLINIIRNDGEMGVGITYDEIGSTVAAFRSGGRILYGILGIGYNHKARNAKYVTEGGFGAHIPVSSRFRINSELRSQFLTDFSDDQITHSTFAIMPAFKIAPHCELFAGPSLNFMYTESIDDTKIFPSHKLWRSFSDKSLKQLYLGFSAGVQYLF